MGRSSLSGIEAFELRHDMEVILAKLPAEHRQICERLKTETITDAAISLGITKKYMYECLREIREAFRELL